MLPSGSVSFVKTLPVTGVSSVALTTSSTASGKSFTGVTTILNVPDPDPPLTSVAI